MLRHAEGRIAQVYSSVAAGSDLQSVIPDDPLRNRTALALRFHVAHAVTHTDAVHRDNEKVRPIQLPDLPTYWNRLYRFASDMVAMHIIDVFSYPTC